MVIVQILIWEAPPRGGDGRGACHIPVHEKGHVIGVFSECFENEFPAGDHLVVVIGGDIGRKQLCLASFVLGAFHGIRDQRDRLLQRSENLVALRLVVLDEITAEPKLVCRIGKGLGAQP